jgi:hypothetical protein
MITTLQYQLKTTLISVLREQVGKTSVKKLEDRLFEKYGKVISEVIEEWSMIGNILVEQYAGGAAKITSKYIAKISKTNPTNRKYVKKVIKNPHTVKKIMNVLGDNDSAKVIAYLRLNTNTIQNIAKKVGLPNTSGYRKIEELIELGMIVEDGYNVSKITHRKIKKYTSPFKSIFIDIEKTIPVINFVPKKDIVLKIA